MRKVVLPPIMKLSRMTGGEGMSIKQGEPYSDPRLLDASRHPVVTNSMDTTCTVSSTRAVWVPERNILWRCINGELKACLDT
jgi:hypothetical protein